MGAISGAVEPVEGKGGSAPKTVSQRVGSALPLKILLEINSGRKCLHCLSWPPLLKLGFGVSQRTQ